MPRARNCLGMLAFMREPVPPARIRKPTLPKPVNSSSLSVDDAEREVRMEVGDAFLRWVMALLCESLLLLFLFFVVAMRDGCSLDADRNAEESEGKSNSWRHSIALVGSDRIMVVLLM